MCLTIPRKILSITKEYVVVENRDLSVEQVQTLIKVKIGDYAIIKNGIIVEIIDKDYIDEFIQILEN